MTSGYEQWFADFERTPEWTIAQPDEWLLTEGERARASFFGDEVHVRGIIEISNICSRDCMYCGLRKSNADLPRYTMKKHEILETVSRAAGIGTIVLQSGENDAENPDRIADIILEIKAAFDVAVTLSLGVKPLAFYRMCRDAGADRYLLKHETATRSLYTRYHPDSRLEERVSALRELKSLGYQTGTGNIIGLPDQTVDDLARDVRLADRLDVDMASFSPFVPHPGTPLSGALRGNLRLALRVMAVARLVLGPVHMPATTAYDAIASDGRLRALQSGGANVIMANLTPNRYRDLYRLYPRDHFADTLGRVREIIAQAGRTVAAGRGDSLKLDPRAEISCGKT